MSELTKKDILEPVVEVLGLENIYVGSRFRKDYGSMDSLIADVKIHGILTPITVARLSDEEQTALKTTKEFRLIAGGRRINASRANNFPTIPAKIYPAGLDERRLRVMELAENEQRKAMEWDEKAELIKNVHTEMVDMFGQKALRPGKADAEGWSKRDTAKLLNVAPATVTDNLKLATAIERVPGLKEHCDSAAEARQALKQAIRDTEAEEREQEFNEGKLDIEPLKEILIKSYIQGNFFERADIIPKESLDFVHMDSPYGIGLDKGRKSEKMIFTEEYVEWDRERYPEMIFDAIKLSNEKLKPSGWMFIWCAIEWVPTVNRICEEIGLVVPKAPLIWTKPNGQTQRPDLYLANAYEVCIYARKGEAKIFRPGRVNHFHYSLTAKSISVHPTHKPVELVQEILSTFLHPKSLGMSPFLGSGCDILAACNAGMSCFGYDLSKTFRGKFIEIVESQNFGEYTGYTKKEEKKEAPQPDLPFEIEE